MRTLDVVVPSYKRLDKLFKCVRSICEARLMCPHLHIHLHLYFSVKEEMEHCMNVEAGKEWIIYHLLDKEFKASEFWNDHLARMEADVLCYLTDDVVLDRFCLMEGWSQMENVKYDGVVGFKINNALDGQPAKAAYGMLGGRYADRFPNRRVFCPDYWCFYLDEELEKYASSIGRFYFADKAMLEHYHPDFVRTAPDECHVHHRRNKPMDIAHYNARKKNNLLWGREFDLVTGED